MKHPVGQKSLFVFLAATALLAFESPPSLAKNLKQNSNIISQAVTQLPAGLSIVATQGDINVTQGASGYSFKNKGRAKKFSLHFDATKIPESDKADSVKIFVRVFNPTDKSTADLNGEVKVAGKNGTITIEAPGLPTKFTGVVIYNANMESGASD